MIRWVCLALCIALVHRMWVVASSMLAPPVAVVALRMRGLREPAKRLLDAWRSLSRAPVRSAARFRARDEFANAVIEAHMAYGDRVPGLPTDPRAFTD